MSNMPLHIHELVDRVKEKDRYAFVHLDLTTGLAGKEIAVDKCGSLAALSRISLFDPPFPDLHGSLTTVRTIPFHMVFLRF